MSARSWSRFVPLALGVLEVATILCALERPAQAYVDPGSGYVFLQVIGSMCAGAIFYLRHRLRRFFGAAGSPANSTDTRE